jgi:hypothetical protein
MSAVLDEDINRLLARGYADIARTHPERRVTVDRVFLTNLLDTLREVDTVTREGSSLPMTQGKCSAMAGILGELLEMTQAAPTTANQGEQQ